MQPTTKKTDAQIQHDVIEELKWDMRVKETDIGVEVKSQVVTLTGRVDTWAERLAAQEAAHRVSGVLDVANDVRVKPPLGFERSDTDVAQAVRTALEWDVFVPHERIRTTVSNGVVTLEGTVNFWGQFEDAARAIRNLAGVREVDNLIAVEPVRVSPQTVRGAIEGALERHALHAAKGVRVAITDGKVVLSGEVPSWAERNAVVGAVRGTSGVWKVDDQLRIHL
jgi:osmotically-inducible protein OsmY